MKRLISILVLGLFAFLSACGAAEEEPEPIEEGEAFASYVVFGFDSMSFTDRSSYDILDGVGTLKTDYLALRTLAGYDTLVAEQRTAYEMVLDILMTMHDVYGYDLHDFMDISLDTFATQAEAIDVSVTTADLFTFQAIKTELNTFSSTERTYSKQAYVEVRLDRSLTDEEYLGLVLLQEMYFELSYNRGIHYNLSQGSFEDFLTVLTAEMLEPTEHLVEVEAAFDVVQTLHQTK